MGEIVRTPAAVVPVGLATILAGLVGCQSQPSENVKPMTAQNLSAKDLVNRSMERRAVEAAIWGIPAVNYDRMFQAMASSAHGGINQILYWTHPSDRKNQTLTPNTDALYLMPFFNTKDAGPIVIEIPPAGPNGSIVGTLMDCWQTLDCLHGC